MGKKLVLVHSRRTSGRWLPGAAAHGSPWSPVESVQREGIPCATPAKLLYCVMHPAKLAVSVKPSTAAQRGPRSNTKNDLLGLPPLASAERSHKSLGLFFFLEHQLY